MIVVRTEEYISHDKSYGNRKGDIWETTPIPANDLLIRKPGGGLIDKWRKATPLEAELHNQGIANVEFINDYTVILHNSSNADISQLLGSGFPRKGYIVGNSQNFKYYSLPLSQEKKIEYNNKSITFNLFKTLQHAINKTNIDTKSGGTQCGKTSTQTGGRSGIQGEHNSSQQETAYTIKKRSRTRTDPMRYTTWYGVIPRSV